MQFKNVKLVELPNGDIGQTMMREFLFNAFHFELLSALTGSTDPKVAEIAAKAVKEVAYQLDRSSDLVVRLGDGTEESHRRMQAALDYLWPYVGEMFVADATDDALTEAGIAPRLTDIQAKWEAIVTDTLEEATLTRPDRRPDVHTGGKQGRHTEHLGYILAEMQFLQRAYPGAEW